MKPFFVEIPIYNLSVCVAVKTTPEKVVKLFKKKTAIGDEGIASIKKHYEDTNWNGKYIFFENGYSIVSLKDIPTIENGWLGVLVHEVFHLTHQMCRYVGIKYSEDSEEAFCYLHEQIFNSILWGIEDRK